MSHLECLRVPSCTCTAVSKSCKFAMDLGPVPPRQEYIGQSPVQVIGNVLRELVDALPEKVRSMPAVAQHVLQAESVLLILNMTGGKA